MTNRMDRNVLLGTYGWNYASVKAQGANARTPAQSVAVLPAFLLKRVSVGTTSP